LGDGDFGFVRITVQDNQIAAEPKHLYVSPTTLRGPVATFFVTSRKTSCGSWWRTAVMVLSNTTEEDFEVGCEFCDGKGRTRSERDGKWYHCDVCGGAGHIPTPLGTRILALVRHNFRPMLREFSRTNESAANTAELEGQVT
jgi:hypothetical protein